MDNSRTFTARDCENLIKAFNEMSEATKNAITGLKEMSAYIDKAKDVATEMKNSCVIDDQKRRAFIEHIKSYLNMHDLVGRTTYPRYYDTKDYCEIRYYDSDDKQIMVDTFNGPHEAITIIDWSEVTDIRCAAKEVINYINRCVIQKGY